MSPLKPVECIRYRFICEQHAYCFACVDCAACRVELGTAGAQASLGLAATAVGRGKAIMISRVAPGSEAEQAGVRPGQRLLAVSDPVRRDEVWPLGDRSSLRYVRDALRMRRCDTVTLELAVDPMLDPGAAPGGPAGEAAAAAACAAASQDEAAASGGSLDEADLLQALGARMQGVLCAL